MDAATAARMSDPEHNPHFRRRWLDPGPPLIVLLPRKRDHDLGPIGLALIEAWERRLHASRADAQGESTAPSVAAPQ